MKPKFTIEMMKEIFSNHGCTLLSEKYEGKKDILKYIFVKICFI